MTAFVCLTNLKKCAEQITWKNREKVERDREKANEVGFFAKSSGSPPKEASAVNYNSGFLFSMQLSSQVQMSFM